MSPSHPELDLAKTTLLLGSGVSRPSNYPLTAEITNALLSKNWLFDRDQGRAPYPLHTLDNNYALRIEAVWGIIRLLRDHVDQHLVLHARGEANYEDIYYLARQVLDGLRGEYDNPGLLPFLIELRTKVPLMVENLNAAYGLISVINNPLEIGLHELMEKSIDFIEECVAGQLVLRQPIKGFDFIDEMLAMDGESPLHIVSLNHDTLLETYLADCDISDGFVSLSQDAEEFDPKDFERDRPFRVRLLKLHGSINWFRYRPADSRQDRILKVLSNDRDHIKGANGEDLYQPLNRLLLAGTTNKELAYGSGVFIELMFQFQKRLKETNLLVASGYGFADKGINNRIWAWLDSRPENRLVVLHEKLDELRRDAKPSFSSNMDRHKDSGKFVIVDKWMCDCALEDVRRELMFAAKASIDER